MEWIHAQPVCSVEHVSCLYITSHILELEIDWLRWGKGSARRAQNSPAGPGHSVRSDKYGSQIHGERIYRFTSLIRDRPPPLGPSYGPTHRSTVVSHGELRPREERPQTARNGADKIHTAPPKHDTQIAAPWHRTAVMRCGALKHATGAAAAPCSAGC